MEINQKDDKNKVTGLVFVGCLFVGMGVGYFTGQFRAGLFIGMGIGFLTSAAYLVRR
ncbi:MAG TPA: hypothetical protein PLW44_07505 [Chitinophagales bacterium]|nr:hypothetical protein [Chitinophagales bacterium]